MGNVFKKRNLELAKMLYSQYKYEQAEKVVMDNIVTAEAKHLMGKICKKTGRMEEAKEWFADAIATSKATKKKWSAPKMELAKIHFLEGKWDLAQSEFEICLKREPQNELFMTAVAWHYIDMGKTEEAKKLLTKALRINSNPKTLKEVLFVYSKMEDYESMYDICEKLTEEMAVAPNEYRLISCMAKTYFNLGKYDKALGVFRGKKDDQIARVMFGIYRQKVYCELHKDKELGKIYQEILDNVESAYSEENRMTHIQKHAQNDTTKKIHGVFTIDINEVMDRVKKAKKEKQKGNGCDIYCIKIEGCGYEGGSQGDGHVLDYVTLITFPDEEKPITLFPSDKIELREKTLNSDEEIR